MNNQNPYHAFLIKHRIYCEHPKCGLTHATTVVNINGRDEVRCDEHAQRLKAARKSDKVFEEQEAKRTATVPGIEMQPQGTTTQTQSQEIKV